MFRRIRAFVTIITAREGCGCHHSSMNYAVRSAFQWKDEGELYTGMDV